MKSELDLAYEEMGRRNEKLYKPIIEKLYGKVIKTSYKFCRVDFLGEAFAGELKSRDLDGNEYNETMIGYNKVEKGFEKLDWYKDHIPSYKMFFWFGFTDGLYTWELTKDNYELNGGDIQKRWGGTSNRGKDDYKDHLYIKKEFLTKVDDTPCWVHPLVAENTKKRKQKSQSTGINPALLAMMKKCKSTF